MIKIKTAIGSKPDLHIAEKSGYVLKGGVMLSESKLRQKLRMRIPVSTKELWFYHGTYICESDQQHCVYGLGESDKVDQN